MTPPKTEIDDRYRELTFLGYALYWVGDGGTVWSKKRKQWKKLAQIEGDGGHLWVSLWKDNRYKAFYVHQLVLMAFVGPCPKGMEACHYPDRSPSNNCAGNLRWGTAVDNAKDRDKHGRTVRGERFWSAKATEEQVIKIRRLWRSGRYRTRIELARRFQLPKGVVESIIKNKTWKHLI